jgi:DNA-binding CsgD family transcriptional regulator
MVPLPESSPALSGSNDNHSTNILPAKDPIFVPPDWRANVPENAPASPQVTAGSAPGFPAKGPTGVIAAAASALHTPGLVILTGPPGIGRTTTLRRVRHAFTGPSYHGGALAMLRGVPALALTRALTVRLPTHDHALLTEAVRSRVRDGLLCLDDLQWADPATLAVLPRLAPHCRIVATLRVPHQLPAPVLTALYTAATATLVIPPLSAREAAALARLEAPAIPSAALPALVHRSGGLPLAIKMLAKAQKTDKTHQSGVEYALVQALADLTRPARTALAALGLLGRPADPSILGPGLTELLAAGLVEPTTTGTAPTSPYLAEVAAGLLDQTTRRAVHRRLATLVTAPEAPHHLAAAGDTHHAYTTALATADLPTINPTDRADLLQLACHLPDLTPPPALRIAAATAALTAGRPTACLQLLDDPHDPHAATLRGEAHLQLGNPTAALTAVAAVPDHHPAPTLIAERDRIRLLATLANGPATTTLTDILTRHGPTPQSTGLQTAIAAANAADRTPGWEKALANAAATAGASGDTLAARWSAWTLVETLAADGRLTQAANAATRAATACSHELAYSWHGRFTAAALWFDTLRGTTQDDVTRRAANLTDLTLPPDAHAYVTAATALTEADSGLLATAQARLSAPRPPSPPAATAALTWVTNETAWLDGNPHPNTPPSTNHPNLVDGLRRITAHWVAHDTHTPPPVDDTHPDDLPPIQQTLTAWREPTKFSQAAQNWQNLVRREHIRCLLATGLNPTNPNEATQALLTAEHLAQETGLVVLLGKTRQALRRYHLHRPNTHKPSGTHLTTRETQTLHLVAEGTPTRRIAIQLGISRETVETHIRSSMRKLGARTRTEAAALLTQKPTRATP